MPFIAALPALQVQVMLPAPVTGESNSSAGPVAKALLALGPLKTMSMTPPVV